MDYNGNSNLVITDGTKIKAYAEHIGKDYLVYFENISPELMYYRFSTRWSMEEFLYRHGIEKFDYKSSNGKTITKVWKYKQEELDEWKDSWSRTKKEKLQGKPEKYSWDDWYCGHFVKEN